MLPIESDRRKAHTLSLLEGVPEKIMDDLCEHVAENGSIVSFCREYGMRMGMVSAWIATDSDRLSAYKAALKLREEHAKEFILSELRNIAHVDIRQLYDADGALLPLNHWPEDVARAVSSVADSPTSGRTLKLFDKLKGLELLGKNLTMFSDRVVHEGKLTLEDLLSKSNESSGT